MKLSIVIASFCLIFSSIGQAHEVYFIRGTGNIASTGMADMVKQLKKRGVNAKDVLMGGGAAVGSDIIARAKKGKVSYPIVIAGHSSGGGEAASLANRLTNNGVPVQLLIGVDAGFLPPSKIEKGTKKVISYKVKPGRAMGPTFYYKPAKGFNGRMSNINVNDVYDDMITHTDLEKHPEVQAAIIRNVLNAL